MISGKSSSPCCRSSSPEPSFAGIEKRKVNAAVSSSIPPPVIALGFSTQIPEKILFNRILSLPKGSLRHTFCFLSLPDIFALAAVSRRSKAAVNAFLEYSPLAFQSLYGYAKKSMTLSVDVNGLWPLLPDTSYLKAFRSSNYLIKILNTQSEPRDVETYRDWKDRGLRKIFEFSLGIILAENHILDSEGVRECIDIISSANPHYLSLALEPYLVLGLYMEAIDFPNLGQHFKGATILHVLAILLLAKPFTGQPKILAIFQAFSAAINSGDLILPPQQSVQLSTTRVDDLVEQLTVDSLKTENEKTILTHCKKVGLIGFVDTVCSLYFPEHLIANFIITVNSQLACANLNTKKRIAESIVKNATSPFAPEDHRDVIAGLYIDAVNFKNLDTSLLHHLCRELIFFSIAPPAYLLEGAIPDQSILAQSLLREVMEHPSTALAVKEEFVRVIIAFIATAALRRHRANAQTLLQFYLNVNDTILAERFCFHLVDSATNPISRIHRQKAEDSIAAILKCFDTYPDAVIQNLCNYLIEFSLKSGVPQKQHENAEALIRTYLISFPSFMSMQIRNAWLALNKKNCLNAAWMQASQSFYTRIFQDNPLNPT